MFIVNTTDLVKGRVVIELCVGHRCQLSFTSASRIETASAALGHSKHRMKGRENPGRFCPVEFLIGRAENGPSHHLSSTTVATSLSQRRREIGRE